MRGRRTPALAWLAAGVLFSSACQQILDIPSDPPSATEFESVMCSCDELLLQGESFGALCTTTIDDLEARTNAGDEAAKELVLTLAASGCSACDNVQSCFVLATDALTPDDCAALGDERCCTNSASCAGWACCTTELTAKAAPNDGVLIDYAGSTCCDSCSPCAEVMTANARTNLCVDSIPLLDDLVDCLAAERLKIGFCLAECAQPATLACRECILDPNNIPTACDSVLDNCLSDSEGRPKQLSGGN
ncbi:MAG: hypothetical protein U0271_44635 [Polyangiaceae bacterium]